MESVLRDLRFSVRQLLKNKSFTLTAVLSLALGIGATTAVFSVVYGVLMDPYPYKDAKRMVHVQLLDKDGRMMGLVFNNGPEFNDLKQAKCVDDVFMERDRTVPMTGDRIPVSVHLGEYTPNLFEYMGVPPLLGRQFTPADVTGGKASQVAVLGYLFWKKQFNASRDVLGKSIEVDHKLYTVIGVAGPRFTWGDSDVYVPFTPTADPHDYSGSFVKLKPGYSLEAARAELEPLLLRWREQDPKNTPPYVRIKVVTLNEQVLGQFSGTLLLLFGAVTLLLVIGCANVSILMLARGAARMHELALRSSVGASRWRIMRQLLTESVLLSLVGAGFGILLAYGAVKWIAAALPFYSFPHEAAIHVSVPVLLFSVALAILTGILFGMSPALQLSRPNLSELIQSGAGRHSGSGSDRKTHRLLITAQVALTLVLLTIAGAATRAFLTAYRIPLGFDVDKVSYLGLALPRKSYPGWTDRANRYEAVRQAIASAPGVEQASVVTTWTPPMQAYTVKVEIEGKQDLTGIQSQVVLTSPEIFETLGIPLVQGRNMNQSELMRAAHVALVNRAFVRKYLGNGDPIGQHLRSPGLKFEQPDFVFAENNDGWFEIVGVVADARNNGGFRNGEENGKDKPIEPAFYVPHTVVMTPYMNFLVRTKGDPAAAIRSAEQRVQSLDPEIAVFDTHPLTWYMETMIWGQQRFIAALFAIFSVLGLVLAATGLYSVVSFSVSQRNQEMGIRMAMGAQRMDIVELVLKSVATTVGVGIVLGLVLSIGLNKIVTHWVQSSSRDPLTLLAVAVILVMIALLACIWPARRAATLDPMKALRTE
ncbi:MAG TPA: ABC transporter permease [Candidatus Eisenbacteria bacterium]|nr:ABC transporter permease [Candidatus Eisenbacteria bacterium]